jgi:menaquinone-9 beta-reductase
VTPGLPPAIAFEHEGEHHLVRPRLVVGADGRGLSIARQIGANLQTDPVHHLIAGLLVDGVHSWPDDEQSVGVHNGVNQLVFPQGSGRIRLYLCYSVEERGRFSGQHAAKNFLEAFRVPTLPHSEEIAAGQIAGPCLGYPNADTWVDEPTAPGVVLIGDAAGHNDPTIGQGLSIAIRDVRLVAGALSNAASWEIGVFSDYVSERRERMRRLRYTARLASKIRCEFGEEADLRRAEIARRIAKDPSVSLPTSPSLIGPFGVPDKAFEEQALKNLLGEKWTITDDGWPVQNGRNEKLRRCMIGQQAVA